jgi:hypothetical protein
MRNKAPLSLIVTLVLLAPPAHAQRMNLQITITAGSPIRLAATSTPVDRLMIQARHNPAGGDGIIYIMDGVAPSKTCNAADPTQLTAELGPGSATSPGQSYSDPQGANGISPPDFTDLANMCLDGTHSGDTAIVTYYARN